MRLLIFGAGKNGTALKNYLEKTSGATIIGFLDNAEDKPVIKSAAGAAIPVYAPDDGVVLEYDQIIITNGRASQIKEIKKQLKGLGVPEHKIQVLIEDKPLLGTVLADILSYNEYTDFRLAWLRDYARYVKERNLPGSIAECGVFRGEFAYFINKYFPDKGFYLFDTFEGFAERDLEIERKLNHGAFMDSEFNSNGFFADTDETFVLERMLHKEKCIVRKGYFPETTLGINDRFCFVNLDMDLYQPTLAGLRFFYDKMDEGAVILLHDYFHPELPGVKQAIQEFEEELGAELCKIPIGDSCSIAIVKRSLLAD